MKFNGIFFALIAAIFFGLIPSTTKIAYNFGSNASLAILLRYFLAVLIILIPFFFVRKEFQLIFKKFFELTLISFGSICLTAGLLLSVIYIPVSFVALIFYTYPLIILGYSYFNKNKLSKLQIIGFVAAFVGLGIALGHSFENLNFIGIGLAFLAAIGASTVLIVNERLSQHLNPIIINSFVNFFCLIFFGIIIYFKYTIELPFNNIGWLFLISAALCYCLAFYMQILAVKNIGSTRTSLLLYIEPLVAIISAILLLNETLTILQIIGTAIVISSLVITSKK